MTLPILWFSAGPIAAGLSSSPITRQFATFAIRVVPAACLASLSIFLCRPAFEGMGRGRPGLAIAVNYGGGSGQSYYGAAAAYGMGSGKIQLSAGAGAERANGATQSRHDA